MNTLVQTLSASALTARVRRFDDFCRQFRRPVLDYFRRRGLSMVDAEDLTQVVFLRLLRKLEADVDPPAAPYIFAAAQSVLIDHHRNLAACGVGGVELDPEAPSSDPGADKILEDRQNLRMMFDVLKTIKPARRRVFMMHRFDSLSYAEIARRTGGSASSVERSIAATLTELKAAIDF